MRGKPEQQLSMLVKRTPEQMVPKDHPIRRIKVIADQILATMEADLDRLYAKRGRPSIPPERLLKGQLLIALFSVRSERLFCEQLDYNMLYRWFLDMSQDEDAFDPTAWSRLRDALVKNAIGESFLHQVVLRAQTMQLMSADHFSVDGTLIEAWASLKSFQRKMLRRRIPRTTRGIRPSTSMESSGRTRHTHRPPTPTRGLLARATARRPSWPSLATRSWRTATG